MAAIEFSTNESNRETLQPFLYEKVLGELCRRGILTEKQVWRCLIILGVKP